MANTKKARGFITYKSYLFREKDYVIDALRTAHSDSRKTYQEVADDSGVKVGTLRSWFGGKTRRPQFATVAAVALACGKTTVRLAKGKVTLE